MAISREKEQRNPILKKIGELVRSSSISRLFSRTGDSSVPQKKYEDREDPSKSKDFIKEPEVKKPNGKNPARPLEDKPQKVNIAELDSTRQRELGSGSRAIVTVEPPEIIPGMFKDADAAPELVEKPPLSKRTDRKDLSELTRIQNQPISEELQSTVRENFANIRSQKIKKLIDEAKKASTSNRESAKTRVIRKTKPSYLSTFPVTKKTRRP